MVIIMFKELKLMFKGIVRGRYKTSDNIPYQGGQETNNVVKGQFNSTKPDLEIENRTREINGILCSGIKQFCKEEHFDDFIFYGGSFELAEMIENGIVLHPVTPENVFRYIDLFTAVYNGVEIGPKKDKIIVSFVHTLNWYLYNSNLEQSTLIVETLRGLEEGSDHHKWISVYLAMMNMSEVLNFDNVVDHDGKLGLLVNGLLDTYSHLQPK